MDSLQCVSTFNDLLLKFHPCFTLPSTQSLVMLASAWVMAFGPRTVTGLARMVGGDGKSHDALQYFFSDASWVMAHLWQMLFAILMDSGLVPSKGQVEIAGDDTLLHHRGPKIFGIGVFRDAVRSTKKRVVYATGHNWVILCLVVRIPFLPHLRISLPINARLRAKAQKKGRKKRSKAKDGGLTTVELLAEMVLEVASWAPERQFCLLADGAYASVFAKLPGNVTMISRLRKDAALYEPPPAKAAGKRGRPHTKGKRLPTPEQRVKSGGLRWQRIDVEVYGKRAEREVSTYSALWYDVGAQQPILIVLVRDPDCPGPFDVFFTPNLEFTASQVVEGYSHRWSQEVLHAEAKGRMGIEGPQARLRRAVERQTPFCLLMISLVKLWYLTVGHRTRPISRDPWYTNKIGVSFQDMLAALRRATWANRFSAGLLVGRKLRKTLRALIEAGCRA